MKKTILTLTAALLCLAQLSTFAQPGPRGRGGMGGPPSPKFGGDLAKIFGANSAFSADLEFILTGTDNLTMPGKLAYLDGQSRFEMDLGQMKSKQPMPPPAQMKEMGLDKMIALGRPDKKVTYLIYPGLQGYVEMPLTDPDAGKSEADYKLEITELGKDSVDGHACVKNKVVSTDKEGKTHESTVWNATDLKNFPVKIETTEPSGTITMLFKNVKLAKPDAAQFAPPADFKKYDSMMAMMQEQMMKRMGGGAGMPPGQ